MTKREPFTEADMTAVSDNPEWTDEEIARARPFAIVFPDLVKSLNDGIEVVRAPAGDGLAVALSGDLAAYYRSFGDEAETRLNADLRLLAGLSAA